MRKVQQKMILSMLETLNEAHFEVKQLCLSGKEASAVSVLGSCQDFALQISDFIDKISGENTQTSVFINEYCKLLYEISLQLNADASKFDFIKPLQKMVNRISNSVRQELKINKIEIAFFPYKYSMFDSFESIWRAAMEDEHCDAYVIPIPYYDKTSNGVLKDMHYEGDLYPPNIPIINWQQYSLEERQPDVVFIHNPYDNGNFVTSVHPSYYAEKLRQYTEHLCYVPYFVNMASPSENSVATQGVLHSDMVFLQSEEIRNFYITQYNKFNMGENLNAPIISAEKKFIALGSPKYDKAINSKAEDFDIPDNWNKLIYRQNSNAKKIVLYNTSISSLLFGGEYYLNKVESVIKSFEKNDDFILWWRPHPLNADTISSMRPKLLKRYRTIVEKYIHNGFGIYDDSADMNRAVALSDAYYGDASSLVGLYESTGKSVLLQSTNIMPESCELLIRAPIEHENKLWVTAQNFNGLFCISGENFEINYIADFPNIPVNEESTYSVACENNNKIYFAPVFSDELAVYDIENNKFENIKLPNPKYKHGNMKGSKFLNAFAYNEFVYFFGSSYPAVLSYNTLNREFEQHISWVKPFSKILSEISSWKGNLIFSSCINGTTVAAIPQQGNAVLIFDMEKNKPEVYSVGPRDAQYRGIEFDGNYYWLLLSNGSLIYWNLNNNEWHLLQTNVTQNCFYNSIKYYNGFLWCAPYKGNEIIKIDTDNMDSTYIELEDRNHYVSNPVAPWLYCRMFMYKESIFFPEEKGFALIEFNMCTETIKKHNLYYKWASREKCYLEGCAPKESVRYTLEDYLNDIKENVESEEDRQKRADRRRSTISNGNGTAGEKIYEMIKSKTLGT